MQSIYFVNYGNAYSLGAGGLLVTGADEDGTVDHANWTEISEADGTADNIDMIRETLATLTGLTVALAEAY